MELTSRIRLVSRKSGLHPRDGGREVSRVEQEQYNEHDCWRADLVPDTLDKSHGLTVELDWAHATITFFGWYSAWK
jgi:hypothetical protein